MSKLDKLTIRIKQLDTLRKLSDGDFEDAMSDPYLNRFIQENFCSCCGEAYPSHTGTCEADPTRYHYPLFT